MLDRITAVCLAAVLGTMVACGGDGSTPGVRSECAAFGGAGLDCEDMPIESSVDACFKLVGCGAIPLENPTDNSDCCLDWAFCVRELERLDDFNRDFVFACIEASSCDELKTDRSPEGPGRGEQGLPLCLQHGNL